MWLDQYKPTGLFLFFLLKILIIDYVAQTGNLNEKKSPGFEWRPL
jgi:hypothetical protein